MLRESWFLMFIIYLLIGIISEKQPSTPSGMNIIGFISTPNLSITFSVVIAPSASKMYLAFIVTDKGSVSPLIGTLSLPSPISGPEKLTVRLSDVGSKFSVTPLLTDEVNGIIRLTQLVRAATLTVTCCA